MADEAEISTTIAPAAEPAPKNHAVPAGFTVLCASLAQHAIEATDRDDDAEFQRALSYRAALRRMAERWAAGEASPTRTSSKKEG